MLDRHEALHAELGDRYELEDMLGEGGMGTVYLAQDRKHDRRVAIKTVRPDLTTEAIRRRFEREISITANLQHPHILPLLDSGSAGETLYYVMPYVEGESLQRRLAREPRLPVDEVVRIGCDVAEGLEYAHERDVIHRDIKPGNILLAANYALIVDFGIAKALAKTGEDTLTQTGWGPGSPHYMAPEQLTGSAAPRSDIYALGAVLYEALTGERWSATSAPDDADWSKIPPNLRPVIRRALERLPEDRWTDARSFRRALKAGGAGPRPRRPALLAVAAALAVAVGSWWVVTSFRESAPGAEAAVNPSIAVLPLENLSGDEETEYFSDGITEDIIAQLSKIAELDVISRNSTMQYKYTDKAIQQIREELNVTAVLDGSVRRDGDRVRIVSQLIDTRTGANLWGETYDRELTDVFAIQADVAQRIAGALRARISPQERSVIERRPTEDIEAHDLYLRGRYLWNRRTRPGLESSVDYFRRAAERDPTYAPAFAGLADAYLLLGSYQYMPEVEATREAKTAVERALALDDRLAEAWASHGQVLRSERDWEAEERAYLRAIELNPNYATAHQWYATLLAARGRGEEAVREIRLAEQLDPLSHAIGVTAAVILFVDRNYQDAIDQLNRTLDLDPEYFSAYVWLMMSYSEIGRYEDAIRAYEQLIRLRPDISQWTLFLANVHGKAGETERAREILERAREETDDRILSAWVYATLGDIDRAIELLAQDLDDESWNMFVFFRNLVFYADEGPWFDPLRSDPRFENLIARMNLP
jgi:serine/threonine-protein kinase